MKDKEIIKIIIAIAILTLIIGFTPLIEFNLTGIGLSILFAFIIIIANLSGKHFAASKLDSAVEHDIWMFSRFGFKPHWHLKKPASAGIILPLVGTAFSLGLLKISSILTYETSALRRRAARRHGRTSFTEMTDWHIALIGASGIVAVLIVSIIAYLIGPISGLAKIAVFYAFWNMIPFSKLDGIQIYFGSRIIWTILAIITLIFTSYALLLP